MIRFLVNNKGELHSFSQDQKIFKYILLVGENGAGKTTYLKEIKKLPILNMFYCVGINDTIYFSDYANTIINHKIARETKSRMSNYFLPNVFPRLMKIDYVEANTQIKSTENPSKAFLTSINTISDKLKDLAREDEISLDNERKATIYLRGITQKWNQLLGSDYLLSTKRVKNTRDDSGVVISVNKDKTGGLNDLSGGELKALALAINMYIFGQSDNLVSLIDEPETNLHPSMQLAFADFYSFKKNNNQIFIATHSPYIVKSFLTKYPDDTLVLHFCRKDKRYTISNAFENKILNNLTLAEINHRVFNIPTIELHICLFDELYQKRKIKNGGKLSIASFEEELKKCKIFNSEIVKLKNQNDFSADKSGILKVGVDDRTGRKINETLVSYIRNCIDHPKHGTFIDIELSKSIELLMDLIKKWE